MKIVSVAQMREWERSAVEAGVSEENLMVLAAQGIAERLDSIFPQADEFIFFCGKGHNGCDGLLASRYLAQKGRAVRCYSPYELGQPDVLPIGEKHISFGENSVLIDALLGISGRSGLSPEIRAVTEKYLQPSSNFVVAIDIPSGVHGDSGEISDGAVTADTTLTCGFPKIGLFTEESCARAGRVQAVPLALPGTWVSDPATDFEFFDIHAARWILPRRRWTAHKGDCGHVCVVAGQEGTTGAAVMAVEGALSSGAGLVTCLVPRQIYHIVSGQVMEAMVRPYESIEELFYMIPEKASSLLVGPGIGLHEKWDDFLMRVLLERSRKTVLDADALTVLSRKSVLMDSLHGNVLLTPHAGEMRRLFNGRGIPRLNAVHDFVGRFPAAVLLKGAYSLVGQKGFNFSVNSTGNPGMASGGMGDVLAGLCAGLCAQGHGVFDAGRLGCFLHGLAADIALREQSYETLLPRHVISFLGEAFQMIRGVGSQPNFLVNGR